MATLTHTSTDYTETTANKLLASYKNYVEKAEFNRLAWGATAITIQGCILSPVLLLVMSHYGGGDWQFLVSIFCFLLVLVPILSAMPVKYIFPAFAISTVLHILMIAIDLL